ncbi:ABC transporter permease subunit [Herbidospora sp. NEAU-GS84]|uniref:ABC transporter permease subunit n=1 Tax=Herbidospora solisilvae TaxID=2696284 RepID=A0A7C9JJ36_9ACTN|nr:ABC transporter permease subunit [Herbidospora solisilvae]NAS26323.1 ABC transporter permease subunit [Herbidospora solisilvae]
MSAAFSRPRAGGGGFGQLLRAEWIKFKSVRGWVAAMAAAALVAVLLGVLSASGDHASCSSGPVEVACPPPVVGPGGEAVDDKFYFVHRPLAGDGGITVRLTSMTGQIRKPDVTPGQRNVVAGVVPWAKAGVMIKESVEQGSAYAAVMMTGEHGVRMQHNFTHDVAGRPGGVSRESPRWLRLTRSGDILTGYESADGTTWTQIGTATLAGLPQTVQIGMFATSPGDLTVTRGDVGGSVAAVRFTEATGEFDQVDLQGDASGAWRDDDIGVTVAPDGSEHHPGRAGQSGGVFSVTGVGDIAPTIEGPTPERPLSSALTGLILVIVVAVMFITAEYRHGLIRTTLLAGPRRGRTLAAKALVLGVVTFAVALPATAITFTVGGRILRDNGNAVLPVSLLTQVRVVVGMAALFALAGVLALALGALLRRSVAAVVTAIALIVVPHVIATTSVLPDSAAQWLLRLTPAAGFAVRQSIPQYAHVLGHYAPIAGFYPLSPWAGLAVPAGYIALILGLAVLRLRRRDA